jgi:hypothetical protein
MSHRLLSDEQITAFKRDGVLLLRNFYRAEDVLAVQRGIHDIIGRVMRQHGLTDRREPFNGENFDSGYQELIGAHRPWGGEVYDAIKQIPAFLRLVSTPAHEQLFTELRPGSTPGVAGGGYGIRIDNPGEDKYRAMWHQEYPAQLRSLDGLVFWSPLVAVTEELGPVKVCVGSHVEGPLAVFEDDPEGAGRSGAYALRIVGEQDYLAKYPIVAPLSNPTDLIVLDFVVLHASGYNTAQRSRWTMQMRYFNFADPTGTSHAWRGSYAAGVDFRKIHPELFIAKPAT